MRRAPRRPLRCQTQATASPPPLPMQGTQPCRGLPPHQRPSLCQGLGLGGLNDEGMGNCTGAEGDRVGGKGPAFAAGGSIWRQLAGHAQRGASELSCPTCCRGGLCLGVTLGDCLGSSLGCGLARGAACDPGKKYTGGPWTFVCSTLAQQWRPLQAPSRQMPRQPSPVAAALANAEAAAVLAGLRPCRLGGRGA